MSIQRLLPEQCTLEGLAASERTVRDAVAHKYEAHFQPWQTEVELAAILKAAGDLSTKTVLDLGCGTGRITRHIKAKKVIGCDFSEKSLQVLHETAPQIDLIWADAKQPCLPPETVDVVISSQVYEQIATAEGRSQFLGAAYRVLKPGGLFIMTAFYNCWLRRALRKRKEWIHYDIFFRCFTSEELRAELRPYFTVRRMRPFQIQGLPGVVAKRLEAFAPLRFFLGHLVAVQALKP